MAKTPFFYRELEHLLIGSSVDNAVRQPVRPGAEGRFGVFQGRDVRHHPQAPRVRRLHDGL